MLGARVAPSFVPDLCAQQELLQHLGAIRNLADAFDAAKAAFGVSILLQTIMTLSPASLSLVLGMLKGAKVLKSSLPWIRAPSYQIVVSTVMLVPLIVSIMAGIFQVAADLWSLGFSICVVLSFLHNFPTAYFLSAKSYSDTAKEMARRGYIQTFFLILAVVFFGCWLAFSERLKEVLGDIDLLTLDNLAAVDRPNTLIWTIVQITLDFLGKAVIAKLCFCDLLLQMIADTELVEPSSHQRVMRDEVHVLYQIGSTPKPMAKGVKAMQASQMQTESAAGQVTLAVTDHDDIAAACSE